MELMEWLEELFDLATARDPRPKIPRARHRGIIVRWIGRLPLVDWWRDGLSPDAACDRAYDREVM